MAIVGIVLGPKAGINVPIMRTDARAADSLVPGATQQASITVGDEPGLYWEVTTDTNIWVNFGSNPSASAENTWLVLAGQTRHWQAKAGDKIAVVAA
jgi:hypothetical protein